MRFRAIVVVGNRKGKVGLGTGKANEVQMAVGKASKAAKRALVLVPIARGTIPHEVEVKFKAAKLRLLPASEGTGIIAGGSLRVIMDHAGVKNVFAKRFGTGNTLVNAQAAMIALGKLKPLRGKAAQEAAAASEKKPQAQQGSVEEVKEVLPVQTISKKEAEERAEIARKAGLQD